MRTKSEILQVSFFAISYPDYLFCSQHCPNPQAPFSPFPTKSVLAVFVSKVDTIPKPDGLAVRYLRPHVKQNSYYAECTRLTLGPYASPQVKQSGRQSVFTVP